MPKGACLKVPVAFRYRKAPGKKFILARHKIHLGFEDPRKACHSEEQAMDVYRDIRDEIRNELGYFYDRILTRELSSK